MTAHSSSPFLKNRPEPTFSDRIGAWIAGRLTATSSGYEPYTQSSPEALAQTLQPGDVLLVEGNQHVSAAIKYLTQSTWSHSALYVGDALPADSADGSAERPRLVEVVLGEGCIAVPLSKYATYNTRICRAVGLLEDDRKAVIDFAIARLGLAYDLKNILDMARYLIPTPPVPTRWRRKMLAFGSGDPTRAICSTMLAEAFQSVRYPILPDIHRMSPEERRARHDPHAHFTREEILHIRHHSLFAPRDFDLSPYFRIVKPTLEAQFDYQALEWGDRHPSEPQP